MVYAKPNFQFSSYDFNNNQNVYNHNYDKFSDKPQSDFYYKSPLKKQQYLPYDAKYQTPMNQQTYDDNQQFHYYNHQDYAPKNLTSKEPVLFIIDFSGSMLDTLGQRKKIDVALNTMRQILPKISPNIPVGLRIYGHKISFTPLDSCLSSELVVKIAPNNGAKIYSALQNAKPRGNTPITYSLKQAVANDFNGYSGNKRIILLSDGGENCDESPCTYVMNLTRQRDDIKIDVIAFDVDGQDANNQLKCTALVTSGKFYKADSENQLVGSLLNSLNIEKDVQGVIIPTINEK